MNKTYAFTDLHGMYDLWAQVRDYCDESDTLYFLGDAADRGDDGIKIMQELLKDKRVIYLMGNHEEFIASRENYLWRINGGKKSMVDFETLSLIDQEYLIKKISKLPYKLTYANKKNQQILLSHAGFTPGLEPKKITDYCWDRDHELDDWPKEEEYQSTFIVHGHTPAPYMQIDYDIPVTLDKYEIFEPVIYANGHKINLDLGSFVSKKISLFDLDELKIVKSFYIGEKN